MTAPSLYWLRNDLRLTDNAPLTAAAAQGPVIFLYVLDDETAQQGRDEVSELLDRFANCKRMGEWPAFGDGYQSIGLPTWAKRSSEVEVAWA